MSKGAISRDTVADLRVSLEGRKDSGNGKSDGRCVEPRPDLLGFAPIYDG